MIRICTKTVFRNVKAFYIQFPFFKQAITIIKAGLAFAEGFYFGPLKDHPGGISRFEKIFVVGLSVI